MLPLRRVVNAEDGRRAFVIGRGCFSMAAPSKEQAEEVEGGRQIFVASVHLKKAKTHRNT